MFTARPFILFCCSFLVSTIIINIKNYQTLTKAQFFSRLMVFGYFIGVFALFAAFYWFLIDVVHFPAAFVGLPVFAFGVLVMYPFYRWFMQ